MSWQESVNMFVWGFVIGYVWSPFWNIIKKIINEAKKAKEEW